MKYPLENLTDAEFEDLVALICERILGMGTIIFSIGKDGGKDAKFIGKANKFPSEIKPWEGKIIIQAKHTTRINASCSDSDFQTIIKKNIIPTINNLIEEKRLDYYLLFTNRKLSGVQADKLDDIFDKEKIPVENRLIAFERIQLWLKEYPGIAKILNLNKLLLPLDFNEEDIKKIIIAFANLDIKESKLPEIPEKRDIGKKNEINKLSRDYFNNAIKKNLTYFKQINTFLEDPINEEFLNKYQNTIDDINEEIIVHRDEYDKFEEILNHLYKFILNKNPELNNNRLLIRLFLQYMYYNCDIGRNE